MDITNEQEKIQQEALDFARKNKKEIAKRRTDQSRYISEKNPVSVFMAGSPGAGKTEASIELLALMEESSSETLRIDPDEFRTEFASYTGDIAWLFQKGVSVLVDKIHDLALKQKQSFVLDGTLSHYDKAEENISRSLQKGRFVQILYVYQEPQLAWEFVRAREMVENRRIEPEHFIKQYFAARDVVNRLKVKFGQDIQVDLLIKNIDNSNRFYKANVDQIDNHIKEKYTRADIENMIGLG